MWLIILRDCLITLLAVAGFYIYDYVIRCYYDVTLFELLYYRKMPLKGANKGPFLQEVPGIIVCVTADLSVVIISDILFRPLWFWLIVGIIAACVALMLLVVHYRAIKFFFLSHMHSKIYDEFYVDPKSVELEFPEKKRNLIYIFMESMETCYSKRQNGSTEYMKELTEFAENGADFSKDGEINGAYAIPGATFTTGAMVAHLSGVPISRMIPGSKHRDRAFLPRLTMLGDILKDKGYNAEFILGSDIKFGGRESLMRDHGGAKIFDYKEAKRTGMIPKDYHVFWGYEDEKLFAGARQELCQLAKQENPFAFTMLTVDTHFLDGYKCRLCPDTFKEQYGNAIACSSRQVADFIGWIKRQPFYENTTIVLVGDHPTMDSGFIKRAGLRGQERKSFVAYVNAPSTLTEEEHLYTTLDLFPTTLAALNVKIPGEHLGLGTNLFSNEKTLYELKGRKWLDNELTKRARFYKRFL